MFTFSWMGSRVPKKIMLPDNRIETVKYMRDGICLFESGHSASYKRIGDNKAEFTMIETFEQAQNVSSKYIINLKENNMKTIKEPKTYNVKIALKAIVEIYVKADSIESAMELATKNLDQTDLFSKKVGVIDVNYNAFGAESSNGWDMMDD